MLDCGELGQRQAGVCSERGKEEQRMDSLDSGRWASLGMTVQFVSGQSPSQCLISFDADYHMFVDSVHSNVYIQNGWNGVYSRHGTITIPMWQ